MNNIYPLQERKLVKLQKGWLIPSGFTRVMLEEENKSGHVKMSGVKVNSENPYSVNGPGYKGFKSLGVHFKRFTQRSVGVVNEISSGRCERIGTLSVSSLIVFCDCRKRVL